MRTDVDLPLECTAWVADVDRVMQRDWCIDTNDAGWSREDVFRYWRYGEPAESFVAWFAEKYELIRFVSASSPPRVPEVVNAGSPD